MRAGAAPCWWSAICAVFIVSFMLSCSSAQLPNFNPDESRWISRAHYLADVADPFGETWQDQYMTRGQPPFGSYVTGLGLLLHGRDLATNPPWDFAQTWEANLAAGARPVWADLQAARSTSALLVAATAVTLVGIASVFVPPGWALLAGLIFAVHPFSRYIGALATADAAFGLLIALAALAMAQYARRRSWQWAAAVGVLLGLGGATKLSPLAVAAALAIGGIALACGPEWIRPAGSRRFAGHGVLIAVAAGVAFLVVYPYLWPDPVGRTVNLFTFRVDEMAAQASDWPVMAVPTRAEALRRTALNFTDHYSLTGSLAAIMHVRPPRALPQLEVLLAVTGVALMARESLRAGLNSAQALVLALLGGQVAITIMGMRSEFDRYHLPAALLGAVAICVSVHALYAWVWLALLAWRAGPPAPGERVSARG
ncbi:MAG: glycosyltransferase family 39 protein [Thermomicrobiales bacterium]